MTRPDTPGADDTDSPDESYQPTLPPSGDPDEELEQTRDLNPTVVEGDLGDTLQVGTAQRAEYPTAHEKTALPTGQPVIDLKSGAELGNYRLERAVGEGAQGQVWLAKNLVAKRQVALKFLSGRYSKDPRALDVMRAEAGVLFDLTHEGIVRLMNIESIGSHMFLVMEFLAGPSLADVLKKRRRSVNPGLSVDECLWLLEQLAPPLDYASSNQVTHRDIKPGNLMLTQQVDASTPLNESNAEVKLCDFGIAFVSLDKVDEEKRVAPTGTPPYMAPEVLSGHVPTPAADIYSLGATLYALHTGAAPFRGTLTEIARQARTETPPPLNSGNKTFDAAIARALAKKPEDRPESADDLLYEASNKQLGRRAQERTRSYWMAFAASTVIAATAIGYAGWRFSTKASQAEFQSPVEGLVTNSEILDLAFTLANFDVNEVEVGFRDGAKWDPIGRNDDKVFTSELTFPYPGEHVIELREIGGKRLFGSRKVTYDNTVKLGGQPVRVEDDGPFDVVDSVRVTFAVGEPNVSVQHLDGDENPLLELVFTGGQATAEIALNRRPGKFEWTQELEFWFADAYGNTAQVPVTVAVYDRSRLIADYKTRFPLKEANWSSLALAGNLQVLNEWEAEVEAETKRLSAEERNDLLTSAPRGTLAAQLRKRVAELEKPTVELDAPGTGTLVPIEGLDHLYTNQLQLTIQGKVLNPLATIVYMRTSGRTAPDQLTIDLDDGTFSTTLRLDTQPVYELEFSLPDQAPTWGLNVIYDGTPPELGPLELPEVAINEAEYPLAVRLEDGTSGVAKVLLRTGERAEDLVRDAQDETLWRGKAVLATEGVNEYELTAVDRAGNNLMRGFQLTLDTTRPTRESYEPQGAEIRAGQATTYRFEFDEELKADARAEWWVTPLGGSDAEPVKQAVDNLEVVGTAARFSLTLDDVEVEAITVAVMVEDIAGNASNTERTWSVGFSRWGSTPERIQAGAEFIEPAELVGLVGERLGQEEFVLDGGKRFLRCIRHRETGIVFLYVPSGSFELGTQKAGRLDPGDALAPVEVNMSGFYIARTEVSRGQFLASKAPQRYDDQRDEDPEVPIKVNMRDASVWCLKHDFQLPTEAQWEYAASGPENNEFPWGNTFDGDRAHWRQKNSNPSPPLIAVEAMPDGRSWCGALQLSGNAPEYCRDILDTSNMAPGATDPVGPEGAGGGLQIARGGSFNATRPVKLSTYFRAKLTADPDTLIRQIGFRPVWEID